jgi:hydroxymethylbilane synthase
MADQGANAPLQHVVIATRGSNLARVQTDCVVAHLKLHHPGLTTEIRIIKTTGDASQEASLTELGLGVFTKELEVELLAHRADLAVHSLKDMSTEAPVGLEVLTVMKREDPRDVLVSRGGLKLADLAPGAVIGTSSPRRAALVQAIRPDIAVAPIRGNVETRLRKLNEGSFDAIVLAAAGLIRLGLQAEVTEFLDPMTFTPAVGQGAVALQGRSDDAALATLLELLDHADTHEAVLAERAFLVTLGGGCKMPMGAHAVIEGNTLRASGMVASLDGTECYRADIEGAVGDAESLGRQLAQKLLDQGAKILLAGGTV